MVLRRIKESSRYKAMKAFFEKYERFLVPGMLLVGVAVDFITFRTISIKTAFILLGVHATLAGIIILFVNVADDRTWSERSVVLRYLRLVSPLILQLNFGALLSASFIFYWFSGSFSVSWPILIIVAGLMASNEVLREYYLRPIVQVTVYFFALYSLAILILPFTLNSIESWVFIVAGAISLIIIYLYIGLFARLLPSIRKTSSPMIVSALVVYLVMNVLYFMNVIPPIPLSIREAGVFHHLERVGAGYLVQEEQQSFLEKVLPGQTLHVQPTDDLFVFTSIFAPADLNTTIVHEWQYFDREAGKWVNQGNFSYPIFGGRDAGYRGYSRRSNLAEGRWRVDVQTPSGQVLGRVRFRVQHVETAPVLIEANR